MATQTIPLTRKITTLLQDPARTLHLIRARLTKPAVPENSSYVYFRTDNEIETVIYLYNYWSENYKIETPTIHFELFTPEGVSKGTHDVTLSPNACTAVRGNDILSHLHLQTPFEGSVLATISDPKLVDGRPLQMNVDYFYAQGARVSTVHSQWGKVTRPENEVLASFHYSADPNEETYIVLRNTLAPGRREKVKPATITLINHAGEKNTHEIPSIPASGMVRLNLRELFPAAETFLGKKEGNIEVKSPTVMGRCLFYHHSKNENAYSFNHATQDVVFHARGAYSAEEMTRMGIGPVATGPVIWKNDHETYVLPFADFHDGQAAYTFNLSIFDAQGKEVVSREKILTLRPRQLETLEMTPLLNEAGVKAPFEGAFRLSFHHESPDAKYPHTFHYIAGHRSPGTHTEFQFDSGLFNMPTHNLSNEFQTSKIFSRILSTENFKAGVFLTNSSGEKGYSKTSSTLIQVFDTQGKTVAEKAYAIPANGCLYLDLENEFPTLRESLRAGNGNGVVKIRDRTARVTGIHYILNRAGTILAADHLVGG